MASKMKEKFGVGWQRTTSKPLRHFFVGELPICGSKVRKTNAIDSLPKSYCKRCMGSLETALEKSR